MRLECREAHHEFTSENSGYVFSIPHDLQYEILVDLDALMFELNACCEQIQEFFAALHQYVGKPIPEKQLVPTIQNIIKEAKQDIDWFKLLDSYRNFFIHKGTPYFSVDLSNAPESYDIIIMRENLSAFKDKNKFVLLSQLQRVIDGFTCSKYVLQEHLAGLFSR